MAREFSRTQRIADQIQRLTAQLISRELKDPRVGMVTINGVDVSKDLGYADIYFTLLTLDGLSGQSDQVKQTEEVLNHAAGFLRSELGRQMTVRIVPHLRFHYDQSVLYGSKLSSLIDSAVSRDAELSKQHQDENLAPFSTTDSTTENKTGRER